MKDIERILAGCLLVYLFPAVAYAQKEVKEDLLCGNMDNWIVREVKESKVIGGKSKYVYEIAEGDTICGNVAYKNAGSPWGTSNVMAKVKGVVKTSVTVFPEARGEGYCARLETRIEDCKVIDLFHIRVLASGTVFLGEMVEPITGTKNPQSKLITGIPYTKRPVALEYDYKVVTGGACIKATGFGKQSRLGINDMAETNLALQHRWEDENGNVYAKRIGTAWERFAETKPDWQNNHRLKIVYGDISSQPYFQPYMDLRSGDSAHYTRNSKGKMVPVQEVDWGGENDQVTHIILQFSSSNGGAYTGSTDSRFWIDNVRLVHVNEEW